MFHWDSPAAEAGVGILPLNLPEVIRRLCEAQGVTFFDLTPCLQANSRRTGELLFNPLIDNHLNNAGSRVVAEALAQELVGK